MQISRSITLSILKKVDEANEFQKTILMKKLQDYNKGKINGLNIGVWGLSYKKNTNDVRESPSVKFILNAFKEGAKITCYDPQAVEEAKKILGEKVIYAKTKELALKNANVLMVFTEWDEFKAADFGKMKNDGIKAIFDGRNLYEPKEVKSAGLDYFGIGRK